MYLSPPEIDEPLCTGKPTLKSFIRPQYTHSFKVLISSTFLIGCSDITFHADEAEKSITTVYLSSVPAIHLSDIVTKFKTALGHESNHLDMKRMQAVVERTALKLSNQMEVDAHESLSSAIISNFLYGTGEQLVSGLSSELQRYKTLAGWSEEQWESVFKKSVHA